MATREITNSDDVIDSRDVIERIEELQDQRDNPESDPLSEENAEELDALIALQLEAEDYAPGWQHGATLIRDSYFVEYAEELCKDIGDVPHNIPGYIKIDWGATAENIKDDYTSVDFDGVTYWVR